MNTAEMWLKAQKDGKLYECINGDIAYSKELGLVDKDNFDEAWGLDSWGNGAHGIDEFLGNCEWEEMCEVMTIKEAEEKFGIRIIRRR